MVMKAARVTDTRGPSGVRAVEVEQPVPGANDVLIDVHVAGVAFPDLLLSRGSYQRSLPLPFTPGAEVAGVVRSAPTGASVRPGDRVAAILPHFGGFAETAVAPAQYVFPLPDAVEFDVAAAFPINYLTTHLALRGRTELLRGETVLVQGAAGGVGVAATQLARAWGARVVAVASTPQKREVAREAGAHHVLAVDGFLDAVRELVPGGIDVVVDPVGGDRFLDSVRALTDGGRLLVVGFAAGTIPTLKVNRLLLRNLSVIGVNLGVSSDGINVEVDAELQSRWDDLVPLLASGDLRVPIGLELPLERAGDALAAIEERAVHGKVVLRVR